MSKWTKEQELAINKEGTNIIVSAGAGSGKTAVLTERVINKLRKGININRLLVLTFTNAAAAEMKDRIRKAIIKEKMYEQLEYIDASYITTFDSYAQSIVKKYHYLLNISSNLKIVDDTIINIETNRIIDDLFENSYGTPSFDNLISSFCTKDDKKIKDVIISLNNKLDLKIDKEAFLDTYINDYYNDDNINMLLDEYVSLVKDKKDVVINLLNELKSYLDDKKYAKLEPYYIALSSANTYDEIRLSITQSEYPSLGKLEDAKEINDNIKIELGSLKDLCLYSYDELKENLLSTKDNVCEIIRLIKELSSALEKYKYSNNSYTFNDIAKMAVGIIKNNKEVQDELKYFYNEIMVDEYQDTSDIQEEFISLISNNNVYMVGDIKQSIYRFRNANPDIFRNKYNDYSHSINGYKIDLLKNFRSREEVLSNINDIFDYIMDEHIGNAAYKESHRMISGNTIYDLKDIDFNYNMDILRYQKDDNYKEYTNDEIEAFIVANDIKNKVEKGYKIIDPDTKELRPIQYGDFCIIMDRSSSFTTYSKIFESLSIPIVVWQDEKLNTEDDIAILKNIVNLIIKVKENNFDKEFKYYFTSIARSYLFDYTDQYIFDIFVSENYKNNELYEIVTKIANDIDSLTNNELLDKIITEFKIYEKSILKGNIDASMIRYSILSDLFSSLSELGYTPYDLPEYFKSSSKLDIKYSLNAKIPGNVNIMTIHKSKGLEFSICYFAGLAKSFNTEDIKKSFLYDNKYGIIIPYYKDGIGSTILNTLYKNKYILEDISEKIRLFYVGLTRAKEKIIIVAPIKDEDTYIEEIVPDHIRMKYKSILDMLTSIKSKINSYFKDINLEDINLNKDYNLSKNGNNLPNIFSDDKKIEVKEISILNEEIKDTHFSKTTNKLYTKEEISNMEYGTYMHYLFEITDFTDPNINDSKIQNFINNLDLTNAKIYKEYEFIYVEDNTRKHGIIDLMLEYDDHIDIIDYKLKNTIDPNYQNQINGYKKYITNKTGKTVNTYLYSILNEEFNEVK